MKKLRSMLRRDGRRLQRAEQRFFDAHGRGGALRHRPLVLPLDYLSRPAVRRILEAWLQGRAPLDLQALERAWARDRPGEDVALFYENMATFLALVAHPGSARVTWCLPDGRAFGYGSEVFR